MNSPVSETALGATATARPASTTSLAPIPHGRTPAADTRAEAILYSFRRCPYAIRARLGLAAAGLRPGIDLELREVSLKAKPPELRAASAKGTVPVLVLAGGTADAISDPDRRPQQAATLAGTPQPWSATGACIDTPLSAATSTVLDQSLAILRWALDQRDPHGWSRGWSAAEADTLAALIAENDGPLKQHLDRFKYAGRFGEAGLAEQQQQRQGGLAILRDWNRRLQAGGWLLGARPSLADIALLPFVRQFRLADPAGFDAEPQLEAVQGWLQRFLASTQLEAVMAEPWASRTPWRSPGWLYHLALRPEWQAARATGLYDRSTRGRSLQEVGFVHLSHAHQVEATAARFYADVPAGDLLLLTLDPERLREAGLVVRLEPAPGSGELFPHLYGPLPTGAVRLAEPWRRATPDPA